MKLFSIRIIVFFFFVLFLASCSEHIVGEGETVSQTFLPVSNFSKISVDNDIDVTVKYSTTKKVEVAGYKNLVEKVRISATNGTLRIAMKDEYTYDNMNLTAVVSLPSFSQIFVTHNGNVEIDSFPNIFTTLHFGLSSNGNLTTLHPLTSQGMTADLSGSGSVTINGVCKNLDLNLTSSGNWNGFNHSCGTATVNITNQGQAEVSPEFKLNATISGSGNIYYKRYPVVLSTITGTGAAIDAN